MSPTVLITAFEPYDHWNENSSWLALLELTKHLPEVPKVVTRLYPVDFSRARAKLEQDLLQNYDFSLHVGQAPGSARIRLEAVGLNIGGSSAQYPDEFRPLDAEGPAAYASDLPLASWAAKLRFSGLPAAVSYHAGTYLCNALLYLALHFSQRRKLRTRSTFVHLPLAPQQVTRESKDMPTMAPESTAKALKLLLQELAQRGENLRGSA